MFALTIPNPIGWAADQVAGAVGSAAETAIQSFSAWIISSAVWMASAALRVGTETTDPNIKAGWFTDNIFGTSAKIAAVLFGIALVYSVASAALRGAPGEMIGMLVVQAPKTILLSLMVVEFTWVTMKAGDEVSVMFIDSAMGANLETVWESLFAMGEMSTLGTVFTSSVAVLLAVVLMLASILVWTILLLRGAAIYLLLALAPFAGAAMVSKYRGTARKLLELLFMVVIAKPIIVLVMVIGASAILNAPMVGDAFGEGPTHSLDSAALPPGMTVSVPADANTVDDGEAENAGTEALGQLFAGTSIMILALFAPWIVFSLMPGGEAVAALSQQGKGGPVSDIAQAPGVAGARSAAARHRAKPPKPSKPVGKT